MSINSRMLRVLGSGLVLGVATAGLSFIAPASPLGPIASHAATGGGSIVYVKGYNVWITDGDGGAQSQVTSGGTAADPWQSPTQSDEGVVVAHHGGVVYRMNQRGEVLNSFDPPDLADTLSNPVSGRDLTETAISPDGTKIAYTYYKFFDGQKRWATGFTSATSVTPPTQWGVAYYDKPAWVTNSRVVLNSWYRNKSHLYDLGQRDIPWFEERFYANPAKELSDLEVSRDGRWTVGVRGDTGDQTIVVIANGGDVMTSVTPWTPVFGTTTPCELGVSDHNLTEPTVAPDGSTVAWSEPSGIYRASDMNCDGSTRMNILVAAGGADPSWSAAAIGRTPEVPQAKQFTVKKKPKVLGKPVVGRVLSVKRGGWAPVPKTFRFRWLRDGKPIVKATKVRYRLAKRDRGHKIAVKVSVSRTGWLTTTKTTTPVRIKR